MRHLYLDEAVNIWSSTVPTTSAPGQFSNPKARQTIDVPLEDVKVRIRSLGSSYVGWIMGALVRRHQVRFEFPVKRTTGCANGQPSRPGDKPDMEQMQGGGLPT